MSKHSYSYARDRVIRYIGTRTANGEIGNFDIGKIFDDERLDCPKSWATAIARELSNQGLGVALVGLDKAGIVPNGSMIDRARELAEKDTLLGRLKSVPRSDWIALAAFIVSIIALFKGN